MDTGTGDANETGNGKVDCVREFRTAIAALFVLGFLG